MVPFKGIIANHYYNQILSTFPGCIPFNGPMKVEVIAGGASGFVQHTKRPLRPLIQLEILGNLFTKVAKLLVSRWAH